MDGVETTRAQETRGLRHDFLLVLIRGHGQHGLADDDVSGSIRKTACSSRGINNLVGTRRACGNCSYIGADIGAGIRILVDADIAAGAPREDLFGGDAQTRRELYNSGALKRNVVEEEFGGFAAAGAKDFLS